MTNYEAMRLMDKDALVEFLSSILDGEAIRIMDKYELANFLSRFRDCKKCPASEKFCDGQRDCVDAITLLTILKNNGATTGTMRRMNTTPASLMSGRTIGRQSKTGNMAMHTSAISLM